MIRFHYTFLLVALIYVLTGYYVNLIVLTTLLIVHELGHYTVAKALNFKVTEIIIYPFGGITKINDLINKDINEELLVAVAGVIWQFGYFLVMMYLNREGIIRDYTFEIYEKYNRQIIFFNLLPIIPLDGFKILNLLVSKIFNYNLSNKVSGIVSIISIIIYALLNNYVHNYSYFMIVTVLFLYNYKFISNLKYLYNKFLLERYIYNIKFSKTKVINNKLKMYKNKTHIFKVNNKYISEKRFLKGIFK